MISKEKFAAMQDHSILEADASLDDTKQRCDETMKYGFAATYVLPCNVAWAREYCAGKGKIGTVIGFPLGAAKTCVKIFEAKEAVRDGADKLDVVMNIGKLKSGDVAYVEKELSEFVFHKNFHRLRNVGLQDRRHTHDEENGGRQNKNQSGG